MFSNTCICLSITVLSFVTWKTHEVYSIFVLDITLLSPPKYLIKVVIPFLSVSYNNKHIPTHRETHEELKIQTLFCWCFYAVNKIHTCWKTRLCLTPSSPHLSAARLCQRAAWMLFVSWLSTAGFEGHCTPAVPSTDIKSFPSKCVRIWNTDLT
jgi:hypothetical protein